MQLSNSKLRLQRRVGELRSADFLLQQGFRTAAEMLALRAQQLREAW